MDAIVRRLNDLEVIIWYSTSSFISFIYCVKLTKTYSFFFFPSRLKEHYKLGSHGSLSKNSVYQHYLESYPSWKNNDAQQSDYHDGDAMPKEKEKALLSATSFGKLVRRAFPGITYNRKGPRGQSVQHYTHLKRIDHDLKLKQLITMSAFPLQVYLSPSSSPVSSPSSSPPLHTNAASPPMSSSAPHQNCISTCRVPLRPSTVNCSLPRVASDQAFPHLYGQGFSTNYRRLLLPVPPSRGQATVEEL